MGRGEARGECGARVDQMPRIGPTGQRARRGRGPAGLRARRRDDRRDGRATRRRLRRRRRRARDLRHDADRLGGDARAGRGRRPLRDPAHRAGQVPRRRAEQRGRSVPQLGRPHVRDLPAPATARRPRSAIPAGCRSGRRIRAASGCRSRTPRGAAQLVDLDLTHDAAVGAPRRVRGRGFRDPAHDRRVARSPRSASSRPAAGRVSKRGCRRSRTAPALPVHVCAVPEGGALGAAFLARMAAGLETVDARRGALGAHVARRRPRPDMGRARSPTATRGSAWSRVDGASAGGLVASPAWPSTSRSTATRAWARATARSGRRASSISTTTASRSSSIPAAQPEDKVVLAAQGCPTQAIAVVRDGEKLV